VKPVRAFFSRHSLFVAAVSAVLACTAGCLGGKKGRPDARSGPRWMRPPGGTNQQGLMIAPAVSPSGRVAMVNNKARYIVIVFPVGQVPPVNTRLSVFHGEARTGEVRITGPTTDNLTVADLLSGGALEDDLVRGE
jgi:hypothetical protein